jgi:hypothetical protein
MSFKLHMHVWERVESRILSLCYYRCYLQQILSMYQWDIQLIHLDSLVVQSL